MACRIGFPDWFRLYSSPWEWTAVEKKVADALDAMGVDYRMPGGVVTLGPGEEIVPMQPTNLKVRAKAGEREKAWEGNCAYCRHRYANDDMECSHCGAPLPASSSSSPWIARERALMDYGSRKSPFPYQEWAARSIINWRV